MAAIFLGVIGQEAAQSSVPSTGTLRALAGGYRTITPTSSNGAETYSVPLKDALLQRSTSSVFSSPFDFPLTDSLGETSAASVARGTWNVREKPLPAVQPTGWRALNSLSWGTTSAKDYVGTASVEGGTATAAVDSSKSTRFVYARNNPALPTGCNSGLKVLLLLDTSASTSGHNLAYRDAAQGFVNAMGGTNSKVKIASFATNSTPAGSFYDMQVPGAGGVSGANAAIQTIYPNNTSGSGYTNWDQALIDASSTQVNLVVLITDGNPTTRRSGSTSSSTKIDDITFAVASANSVKDPDGDVGTAADAQTMLAVGVGSVSEVSTTNLAAVSGPTQGVDYINPANPEDLQAVLEKLAGRLCGGSVKVHKVVAGPAEADAGFTVSLDTTPVLTNVQNASTEDIPVGVGDHTVSEVAGNGETDLSNYTAAYDCHDVTEPGSPGLPTTNGKFTVVANHKYDCTITNTRKSSTLKIIKKIAGPAEATARFNLLVDGTVKAANVANDGTTGALTVGTGSHTFGETGGTTGPPDNVTTSLTDYTQGVSCQVDGGTPFTPTPSGGTTWSVSVDKDKAVVCTITNTRKTGSLTVTKALSPNTDPGLFDLLVNGSTKKTDATDGGTTGAVTVNTGTSTVSELAGSVGSLANYTTSILCKDGDTTVASGNATSLDVSVTQDQKVVCTITNTRKSATITVAKTVVWPEPVPANTGLFNLQIDGTTQKADAKSGENTGPVAVTAGPHSVGETAGTGTSLSDFTSATVCLNGDQEITPVQGQYDIPEGSSVVCTITNTRQTGSLTIVKTVPLGTPQPFSFTGPHDDVFELVPNGGDGGDTASKTYTLATGTWTASEGTVPTGFVFTSLACSTSEGGATIDGKNLTLNLLAGENITCTWVNTPSATPNPGRAGTAVLAGTTGCAIRTYAAYRVRGTFISSINWYLDGRRVGTATKKSTPAYWKKWFKVSTLSYRVHKVQAVVHFTVGTTPRTKTLTTRFARCTTHLTG
ncbi:MAG: hypothetical protein F2799_06220 [Actinobacteria bacterium]|nr:hypothetical protein [Actinomycetota bacterium]